LRVVAKIVSYLVGGMDA